MEVIGLYCEPPDQTRTGGLPGVVQGYRGQPAP
jgi:hypothetical protein